MTGRASLTLRVHLFADLQRVRVGEVGVGRRDSQDQAALFGDELQQHVSDGRRRRAVSVSLGSCT